MFKLYTLIHPGQQPVINVIVHLSTDLNKFAADYLGRPCSVLKKHCAVLQKKRKTQSARVKNWHVWVQTPYPLFKLRFYFTLVTFWCNSQNVNIFSGTSCLHTWFTCVSNGTNRRRAAQCSPVALSLSKKLNSRLKLRQVIQRCPHFEHINSFIIQESTLKTK